MGVLGWGYDETLDTPMTIIERALTSRHKLIGDILQVFAGVPQDVKVRTRPVSPMLFDAIFSRKG